MTRKEKLQAIFFFTIGQVMFLPNKCPRDWYEISVSMIAMLIAIFIFVPVADKFINKT